MLIRTIEGVTRTKGTQGIFGVVLEDFINENRYTLALFFPFSLLNQSGPAEQLVASPILHSWGNEFDASPVPYFRED